MKIQTKLTILISIIIIIFISGLILIDQSEKKKIASILQNRAREKNALLDLVVELNGNSIKNLANDYTYWDEMVEFVRNPSPQWATDNLELSFSTYNVNAIWIFRPDYSRVYSVNNINDTALSEFPLSPDILKAIFSENKFCHFFIKTSAGPIEVRGAPIQPSSDAGRTSPAQGYFIAGRIWNDGYLKELSSLTESDLKIAAPGAKSQFDSAYYSIDGLIHFSLTLRSWDNKPIIEIQAVNQSEMISEVQNSAENNIWLFVIYIFIILTILIVALMKWVSTPLNLISRSLNNGNSSELKELEKDKSEFGHLAQLIKTFFEQNSDLLKEVIERTEAEKELRESEHYFKALFDTARAGIVVVDAKDQTIVDANQYALEKIGKDKETLIGKECRGLLCHGKIECHKLHDRNRTVEHSEGSISRNDGSSCEIIRSFTTVIRHGRKYFVESFVDISELRKYEQELHNSVEKYRYLIENITNGVIISDFESGKILYANNVACTIAGYNLTELMEISIFDLVAEDSLDKLKAEIKKRRTGQEGRYELLIVRKDKQRRRLTMTAKPYYDGQGVLRGAFAVLTDITDVKRAEEDKQQLQDKLERAQRMESLGVLAGGVAHDLNNILGPLVAYPELVLMKLPDDSPVRKQVEIMGRSAKEAAEVIADLLSLARRGRYEMAPTHLNKVIEEFMESPSFFGLTTRNSSIDTVMNLDQSINPIMGSSSHLMKVIMNLIYNSFDAMPDGGELTITTSQKNLDKLIGGYDKIVKGEYVLVSVRDTGMGIDSKDIGKIFEPYYSKKTMNARSGSGLGLSVVYGIIKDHKGYYDIISELGKGTEFILYFPIIRVDKEIVVDNSGEYDGTERVLVVDDVEEQREVVLQILSSLGYGVETATSGKEAVALVKENKYDLIVLDMILDKDYDGYDTYKEITRLHPKQKAVLTSGYSVTERVEMAQVLGAGKFVKKPFSRDTIAQAVREELDRNDIDISHPIPSPSVK